MFKWRAVCLFCFVLFLSSCMCTVSSKPSNNLSTLNLKTVEIQNDPNRFIGDAITAALLARGAKSDAQGVTLYGTALFQENEGNKNNLFSLELSVKSDDGRWAAHSYVTNRNATEVALPYRTKESLVKLATLKIAEDFSDIVSSQTKKE